MPSHRKSGPSNFRRERIADGHSRIGHGNPHLPKLYPAANRAKPDEHSPESPPGYYARTGKKENAAQRGETQASAGTRRPALKRSRVEPLAVVPAVVLEFRQLPGCETDPTWHRANKESCHRLPRCHREDRKHRPGFA